MHLLQIIICRDFFEDIVFRGLSGKLKCLTELNVVLNMDEKENDAIGMEGEAEPERELADRPAEQTSLKGNSSK